ncbi:MAG TPA: class I SAM-dependent methyltransferase, partial [Candidatus Edwardsbacteria bacterium]|nr:class I SAM-dependent methyltransferase [Candidatus Edwardsbacteria bacterium]
RTLLNRDRQQWSGWSLLHHRPGLYTLEGFRAGQSSLLPVEREELGDVSGRSLLQLQCGYGMDAQCWSRLGARVTGVDFSKKAVEIATALNAELKMDVRFVHATIYELDRKLEGQFDIVYASYGVLYWVPGLDQWAQLVARFLKPGGTFLIVDEHPVALTCQGDLAGTKRPYFSQDDPMAVLALSQDQENGGNGAALEDHGWIHPLSDLINALVRHGLAIASLKEYPFMAYQRFDNMAQGADGYWRLAEQPDRLPLLFSVKAVKR